MEEFAAIRSPMSEKLSPSSRFEPAQTMSDDDKSIVDKVQQQHTLPTLFRGSDEENQADELTVVSKLESGRTLPYQWDDHLDPFVSDPSALNNFFAVSAEKSTKDEISPLQEKRATPLNYTASSSSVRSAKQMLRSRKDQRNSQSSTRSVLSKTTRDLIFNESTDSSDNDNDGPLAKVPSMEEVLPPRIAFIHSLRESLDDHDDRHSVKSFKIKKTQSKQSQKVTKNSSNMSYALVTSASRWSKVPKVDDQEKLPMQRSAGKNEMVRQNPFSISNPFANSCLPSQITKDIKEEKRDVLTIQPPNKLSFLTELFQCGNKYDDDVISPRNTQIILDVFDKTLCGIPAKMANISLDDLLDEEGEDDLDMKRPKSRKTRPPSESKFSNPSSSANVDQSSHLYGLLKEHMNSSPDESKSHTVGRSVDNDPEVQRELQRLCKLLEAKLDGHGPEPAYESDFDDAYYESESESDFDDDEDEKLFQNWMRSGPIMELFGIGCHDKNGAMREITNDDRIMSGRSYHSNDRLYPGEEDEYYDEFDEEYYSDAESTESNLTIVAANDYK
ncbi:hypothetical protein FisN_4Lh185 [Fistulifera solaris]|uniref:Uncharacterized protein n=1 Tax=Fistulifera solaris TaxID=1519565 RepID=A0A1Z5JZC6_FISSO|nr:hypothetical protein FisN_4Lh185 [Fistulifera solaris]|eukprot:GAX19232.1 hypothetical protein FisN_4Lh185 [Fistulifera solaris]